MGIAMHDAEGGNRNSTPEIMQSRTSPFFYMSVRFLPSLNHRTAPHGTRRRLSAGAPLPGSCAIVAPVIRSVSLLIPEVGHVTNGTGPSDPAPCMVTRTGSDIVRSPIMELSMPVSAEMTGSLFVRVIRILRGEPVPVPAPRDVDVTAAARSGDFRADPFPVTLWPGHPAS